MHRLFGLLALFIVIMVIFYKMGWAGHEAYEHYQNPYAISASGAGEYLPPVNQPISSSYLGH